VACSKCAERRRKLKAMLAEKKAKRKGVQAAAIGAVLSVTETAGKVLGIGEDTEDGNADRVFEGNDGQPQSGVHHPDGDS
jgi:hypothetical protein